jgi:hypothetical protein
MIGWQRQKVTFLLGLIKVQNIKTCRRHITAAPVFFTEFVSSITSFKEHLNSIKENNKNTLSYAVWKTKAKDREFWRQRIEEAKTRYGL